MVNIFFSYIFEVAVQPDPVEQERLRLMYMGILFGFALAQFFLSIICNYSFEYTGARLTTRLRAKMFKSMISQEVGFHDQEENKPSILCAKINKTASKCIGLTTDKLSLATHALASAGFAIIHSLVLSYKLSLLMVAFVPINIFAGLMYRKFTFVKKSNSVRMASETTENMKTIIGLGCQEHFFEKYKRSFSKGFKTRLLKLHLAAFFYAVTCSILFFVEIAAFVLTFYLFKTDGLSITDFLKIYGCMTFKLGIYEIFRISLPNQIKAKESAKEVFEVIERRSRINPFSEEGLKPFGSIGEIRLKNIYFNHPSKPKVPVLRGLNLVFQKGEINTLLSHSGNFFLIFFWELNL